MVKIISDSTCDLSDDLLKKYDVTLLSLHILLGEDEYLDRQNITSQEIYAWSDAHKTTPRTSAPSLDAAIELLLPYVKEGREIVCFSISDDMSASGNVMRLAAEELDASDQVTVIKPMNLSTGIGLLVIEAAIMAQNGANANEIVKRIEYLRPLVRASFVVDTLVYLHRGGRCSGLAALAGSALKLHPRIVVDNGKMKPEKKYRGNIGKVIMSYTKDMEQALLNAKADRVFITHSDCSKEIVDEVKDYLESLHHFNEVLEASAGGVISCHCGPGTLGVLFIAES